MIELAVHDGEGHDGAGVEDDQQQPRHPAARACRARARRDPTHPDQRAAGDAHSQQEQGERRLDAWEPGEPEVVPPGDEAGEDHRRHPGAQHPPGGSQCHEHGPAGRDPGPGHLEVPPGTHAGQQLGGRSVPRHPQSAAGHRLESGSDPHLTGVRLRVAEHSPVLVGDLVGEIGLQPLDELEPVLLGQVGQQVPDAGDEAGDVGTDGQIGGVHALTPEEVVWVAEGSRRPSRVAANARQSPR